MKPCCSKSKSYKSWVFGMFLGQWSDLASFSGKKLSRRHCGPTRLLNILLLPGFSGLVYRIALVCMVVLLGRCKNARPRWFCEAQELKPSSVPLSPEMMLGWSWSRKSFPCEKRLHSAIFCLRQIYTRWPLSMEKLLTLNSYIYAQREREIYHYSVCT